MATQISSFEIYFECGKSEFFPIAESLEPFVTSGKVLISWIEANSNDFGVTVYVLGAHINTPGFLEELMVCLGQGIRQLYFSIELPYTLHIKLGIMFSSNNGEQVKDVHSQRKNVDDDCLMTFTLGENVNTIFVKTMLYILRS